MECKLRGVYASILLLCCCGYLSGTEHHFQYTDETDIYDLTFDDRQISVQDMNRLIWFSPYIAPDLPGGPPPFLMASSFTADRVDDKLFLVPNLEDCSSTGREHCGEEPISDAAFLQRAAENLKRGKEQLESLRRQQVPSVLQPVKDYLVENMQFFWDLQNARYLYLKTGATEHLKRELCKQCLCGPSQDKLLELLGTASGIEVKTRMSWDWYNQMHHCHDRHRQKYPVVVWEQFKRQFGIVEHHRGTSPL